MNYDLNTWRCCLGLCMRLKFIILLATMLQWYGWGVEHMEDPNQHSYNHLWVWKMQFHGPRYANVNACCYATACFGFISICVRLEGVISKGIECSLLPMISSISMTLNTKSWTFLCCEIQVWEVILWKVPNASAGQKMQQMGPGNTKIAVSRITLMVGLDKGPSEPSDQATSPLSKL
jgi:hypothetical protein